MDCLWLRVRAPFAAFRGFQAGVYRATAPVMPPSTALGLILNLAGIEMRDGKSLAAPTTLIREDIPNLCIALGSVPGTESEICTLYQQLHTYPVGASGSKDLKPLTKGAKYWITPTRREVLVGLDIVLGVQAETEIYERVRQGIQGKLNVPRYGLPFAGDNNFMFDRIDVLDEPLPTRWYVRMQPADPPKQGSYRLSVCIDRGDNSKTLSLLYAPVEQPTTTPPPEAWTWTPRIPSGLDG